MKKQKKTVAIRDSKGRILFENKGVGAPEAWSETAIVIAASKYFRGPERSVFQLISRVCLALERQVRTQKMTSLKGQISELETDLLLQKGFFNSPVWFNCGLTEKYAIPGSRQHWFFDPKTQKITQNLKGLAHPQVSACFILSIEDSLESIFDLAKVEANLFKYGSGSGTNFSRLRSRDEKLETGGKSSGLISFLDVLDRGAGAIKSGGTTRRAAKMVVIDADHPEILDFIRWKAREEEKARALVKAGFGEGFESEAYRTVSGQNANLSVRLSDRFMNAVENDENWYLKERTSSRLQPIPARKIFSELGLAAWQSADPGVQFHDTIQRWHTCAKSGPIRASNPCSEFLFLDNTACNLASLNMLKFVGKVVGDFDFEAFAQTSSRFFNCMELLVDYAGYPTPETAKNSHRFRPLGLGICGVGAALMRMGIAYDSELARTWVAAVMALQTGVAYLESAKLARERGPFAEFRQNKSGMMKVLRQHRAALQQIAWEFLPVAFKEKVLSTWDELLFLGGQYGFRNSQATAIAPTGTIGLVMDSETTGIEPEYSLIRTKKLAGGGEMVLRSDSVPIALKNLGYSETEIQQSEKVLQRDGNLHRFAFRNPEHAEIFHTAQDISPEGHLKMLAAVQPFVSGAISKTVNLPASATAKDVENLYWQAWQMGIKAVAIYRDGSKGAQVLESRTPSTPACTECGHPTELAGNCWRCTNCGSVTACA